MTANELADELEKYDVYVEKMETDFGGYQYPDFVCITPMANEIANKLRQQTQEINNLKKQITQLSVSREPKIGDRVILIDDESEGVIVSLSIGGNAAINFDDGCYGNYTRVELITLFAYKEIICNKCNDTDWVCENHPDQEAHKCNHCGGAGMPCECTKKASKK